MYDAAMWPFERAAVGGWRRRLAARAGSAAAKGASVAAKVTVAVGVQAIKAAVPVGKWALQQGFKAAAGAVARGLQPEEKKRGKKEKGKGA